MAAGEHIQTRIDRLESEYGDFPVETAVTDLSAPDYQRARELDDRGVPGASRVWVERGEEALLVREQDRTDSWGVAGGLIDPGESAVQAGERERCASTHPPTASGTSDSTLRRNRRNEP
ncbi:NUDIX domain-containing protein [Haloarchaeobius sp. TZWWS8]|uniref:NUDIX domain-containing protein n=1 Tax=Haloarchaeobius sp. TZWWS8 TaxID=3446121 RepID=UPI003EBFD062